MLPIALALAQFAPMIFNAISADFHYVDVNKEVKQPTALRNTIRDYGPATPAVSFQEDPKTPSTLPPVGSPTGGYPQGGLAGLSLTPPALGGRQPSHSAISASRASDTSGSLVTPSQSSRKAAAAVASAPARMASTIDVIATCAP